MPTHLVNLDALIKREDFEASTDAPTSTANLPLEIKVDELEENRTTFFILRKPDFQKRNGELECRKNLPANKELRR